MSHRIQCLCVHLVFLCLGAVVTTGAGSALVAAADDLIEIKQSAHRQVIPFGALLSNDQVLLGYTVQLASSANHGTVSQALNAFIYHPNNSFWDTGADSFTYTLSDGDMMSTATVVLTVAKPPLVYQDGFDLFDYNHFVIVQESGSVVTETSLAAISGPSGLRVTLDGSGSPGAGYIYFPVWAGGVGVGGSGDDEEPPGGSGVDIMMRNLGSLQTGTGSAVLMSACDDGSGWPRYRVRAWRILSQIYMVGEVLDDHDGDLYYESTEPLIVQANDANIDFTYWWSPVGRTGIRLKLDGQLSSTVTSRLSEGDCSEIRVGVMPDSPGQTADVHFDNFKLVFETHQNTEWAAPAPASDGFENGTFTQWTDVIGNDTGIHITSERAISGASSLRVRPYPSQAFELLDASHSPNDPIWNVRFAIDADALVTPEGSDVAILTAGDGHRFLARAKAGLSIVGDQNGRPVLQTTYYESRQTHTGSLGVLDRGSHIIEMQYRSATEPDTDDGFLRIWIDGALAFQRLALENHDVRIDWFRLGATTHDDDVRGELLFDDYMSW